VRHVTSRFLIDQILFLPPAAIANFDIATMSEELGSNLSESRHSGEMQVTPEPSIRAPPVQTEEIGRLSGEMQVLTPNAPPAKEVENSGFMAEQPGSESVANVLPEADQPIGQASRATEAPTAEKVDSSHPLSQLSQHLSIGAMFTSDPPQGAPAQVENSAVDADVCPSIDNSCSSQLIYNFSIVSWGQ